MTDAEWWLAETDPHRMLRGVGRLVSRRKLTLFACACARRAWGQVTAGGDDLALELLETKVESDTYADIRPIVAVGRALAGAAQRLTNGTQAHDYNTTPYFLTAVDDVVVMARVARAAGRLRSGRTIKALRIQERRMQRQILRDIVGNPFCSVSIDPGLRVWNDRTIPNLAAGIYQERAFGQVRILADALEEAGCHEQVILDHLRQRGHTRGCWVIDAILHRS